MAAYGASEYGITGVTVPAVYGGLLTPFDGAAAGEALVKAIEKPLFELPVGRYGLTYYGRSVYDVGGGGPLADDAATIAFSKPLDDTVETSEALVRAVDKALTDGVISIEALVKAISKALSDGVLADDDIEILRLLVLTLEQRGFILSLGDRP